MLNYYYLFLLFLGSAQLVAQNNTWFLGGNEGLVTTGMRFSGPDNTPQPYNDVRFPLDLQENNVMVIDQINQDVRFYSDGRLVVDRLNEVMPEGSGLLGGPSNMYGTTVVFDPSGCNRYYIFYGESEEDPVPRRAYYSIVDLDLPGNGTANNPSGNVDATQKNVLFSPTDANTTEGIYAIPKAFSPNFDGINDVFTVYAKSPNAVIESMQIFDRWGGLVFSATDLPVNDQCCGWDGNFTTTNQPESATKNGDHFIYLITLRYVDGSRQSFSDGLQVVR